MPEIAEHVELIREDRQPTRGTKAKQSNQLAIARHQLGEAEQKLLLYAISMVDPKAKQFCQYRIEISAYAAACGISGHNLKDQLWNAAVAIQRDKPLLILGHVDTDGTVVDLSTHWFAEVRRAPGYIDVTFPPSLTGYLGDVQNKYFKCELGIPLRFRGEYAIRLYQWAKSWQYCTSKEISLADLRAMLGLIEFDRDGKVCNERLNSWGETKKWALSPALKQINASSDISVGMREKKVPGSKRVESVVFTILPNPSYIPDPTVPRLPGVRVAAPADAAAVAMRETLLTEFGVDPETVRMILGQYPVAFIAEKAAIVRSKPRDSAAATLIVALRKNWKPAKRIEKQPAKKAAPSSSAASALTSSEPFGPFPLPKLKERMVAQSTAVHAFEKKEGRSPTDAERAQFVLLSADGSPL